MWKQCVYLVGVEAGLIESGCYLLIGGLRLNHENRETCKGYDVVGEVQLSCRSLSDFQTASARLCRDIGR